MQQVIQSSVDPTTALSVGLKVDTDSLPPAVVQAIKNGTVDLKSPATTVALLKLNAVVGVRGTVATVNGRDELTRVGITCALCHSTVDNSFAPGIGKRLDGFPNHDLNPGAIIALSPALSAEQKAVYNSWGPGQVRRSLQPRREERPIGHSAGVWTAQRSEHHVHGRRSRDLILESLRRGDADARTRPLHRVAPHAARGRAESARLRLGVTARAPGVPAEPVQAARLPRGRTTPRPRRAARACSVAPANARPVTSGRRSPMRREICIRRRRS